MSTVSTYFCRSEGGLTESTVNYDYERLSWKRMPGRWWCPRLTKTMIYLALADLIIVTLAVFLLEPLIVLLWNNDELFRLQMPLLGHRPTLHKDHVGIPRILHQTYANSTIPSKWVDSQKTCKEAYSDFDYKLWTDEAAREFLSADYPWFVDIWDNYAFPIQRADAIRYFVLYHYGGIYLDLDTVCSKPFPLMELESSAATHYALFKSTNPTGVTNAVMVTTARHPAFAATIAKLPLYFRLTRLGARILPYFSIMISTGPLFLSLVIKDYLLHQPSTSSPTVQITAPPELKSYIVEMNSSSWHTVDAKALKWLGTRPWTWFCLGAIVSIAIIYALNKVLLYTIQMLYRRASSIRNSTKPFKIA